VPMPIALALDVGTSSVRALAFDAGSGRVLRRLAAGWGADRGPAPADALLAAVGTVLDGLEAWAATRPRALVAGGVSVLWHSALLVDAQGRARTPVFGWSDLDPRFDEAARRLAATLDGGAVRARVGAPVHPSFPAAKAAALLAGAADGGRARLWGAEDLVTRMLWGRVVKSLSHAGGTGMWDTRAGTWDGAVLAAVGLAVGQLPPVDDGPVRGEPWSDDARRRWPVLGAVPWTRPQGDGALANLGMAALDDVWGATVGTSAALRHLGSAPVPVPLPGSLFSYGLGPGLRVVGGALSGGGNLLAYLARRERVRLADVEPAVQGLDVGAGGVAVVPYVWGERSPGWTTGATGVIAGLTAATPAAAVVRAGVDAIGAGLARIGADLAAARGRPVLVRAGGRAVARSAAVGQMLADALAVEVEVCGAWDESSAIGAARLGLEAAGHPAWPAGAVGAVRFAPRPLAAAYQALGERLERLARAARAAPPPR